MSAIRDWSAILCWTSVICTLAEFFIPPGKIEKTMHMVLSIFILCAFILPISNFNKFNFNFPDFLNNEKFCSEKSFLKNINSQVLELAEMNIESIILRNLKNINMSPKKVEIFMDTNEHNCIVMIRCKIYIQKNQLEMKPIIVNEVENKLNIKTEVMADV